MRLSHTASDTHARFISGDHVLCAGSHFNLSAFCLFTTKPKRKQMCESVSFCMHEGKTQAHSQCVKNEFQNVVNAKLKSAICVQFLQKMLHLLEIKEKNPKMAVKIHKYFIFHTRTIGWRSGARVIQSQRKRRGHGKYDKNIAHCQSHQNSYRTTLFTYCSDSIPFI